MKKFTTLIIILFSLTARAQTPWKYIRPSNTGLGGDYMQVIETDRCGNKWTGGYLPFWSEGSVSRFDDSVWTCWSNFEGYLPADRVYGIAFDQNDGVWVATNGVGNGVPHGGIAHFNGSTWTQYTSANSPLPEDDMRGITVDNNNHVWATFHNVTNSVGGVAKFDGTNWTIYTPSNSGLPSTFTDKIKSDAQNNIWIGTNQGLVKFDGLNWIVYTPQNSGLSGLDVTDVEYDATTDKIYAATGLSIDIYDGSAWSHINSSNAPISATGLWAVDARGDSIIITTVGGTYMTYIYNGIGWMSHQEDNHTYDACIDAEGNFWICGIGFVEKFNGTSWTTYNSKNTGLTGMFNSDVFVDSRNRAWFASNDNGGINMFDCPRWQDYNPYNANLWPQPVGYTGSGTGITEDSQGDIWMAFNGVLGAAVQVDSGDVDNLSAWHVWDNNNSGGVSMQFLNRAAGDKSGNVWFGYDQTCALARYSHATNSWTGYNLFSLGQVTCGAGSGINSIRVDDSNNVWVCGLAGLAKYDQVNWSFYSYLNTPMSQGFVMDIAFDASGNKWVATESGLFKFDDTTWTKYDHTNSPMMGDFVSCVITDKSGMVWLGCNDPVFPYPAGLLSFDGTTWTTYTTSNSGLPEKWVDRLALDTLGNIWVMTAAHGTAIFNPNGVTGYECHDKFHTCLNTSGVSHHAGVHDHHLSVYPNPSALNSTASLITSGADHITITLYDLQGIAVKNIFKGRLPAGNQQFQINTKSLSKGMYILEAASGRFIEKIKLLVN